MGNIEAYEANLKTRLKELRQRDRAYKAHSIFVAEAIICSARMHGNMDAGGQHILDCGCGLGFMTKWLSGFFNNTVGIDPSERAITMAQKEHPGVDFYNSSAESFADRMTSLEIEPFDQAILNMVLHSTDDQTALNILNGVGRCLKPEGTVILIVPTQEWILHKLEEYFNDQGMEKSAISELIENKLTQKEIELPIKISGGEYWPKPITVRNRTEKDYGDLLINSGFGYPWIGYDQKTGKEISREYLPYMDMNDYTPSDELYSHYRTLLMSFYFRLDPELFRNYREESHFPIHTGVYP